MRKILLLLFSIIFLLPSCSDGESTQSGQTGKTERTEQKNNAKDQVLRVGVMSSMDYLPLAVARREGYFDKAGVNVEILKFYSANERDAALQSGNIDGTVTDFTGALLQKAGGFDLVITSRCDAPFYIVAAQNSGIETLEGLKGKKLAVSRHTVIDFCMDMALKRGGIEKDQAEKVEINKIPVRFEMLRAGQIDATGLPDPLASMAAAAGDKILATNQDLGFYITGIVFARPAAESKADAIKGMYAAYDMGVEYLASHGISDVADILKADMGFRAEIISAYTLPDYSPAQMPDPAHLELTGNWLKQNGLIQADFDPQSLADDSFIKP